MTAGGGITSRLLGFFEERAREMNFKVITLGSQEDVFYERCGYHLFTRMHDQNIYQKQL